MPSFFIFYQSLCFTEMSDGSMWRNLKRRHVVKERDFSPRHTDNYDEVVNEQSQGSDVCH
jgi:hypothetical protein